MEPRRQSPGSYDEKMRPGGAKIRLNGGKMLSVLEGYRAVGDFLCHQEPAIGR